MISLDHVKQSVSLLGDVDTVLKILKVSKSLHNKIELKSNPPLLPIIIQIASLDFHSGSWNSIPSQRSPAPGEMF